MEALRLSSEESSESASLLRTAEGLFRQAFIQAHATQDAELVSEILYCMAGVTFARYALGAGEDRKGFEAASHALLTSLTYSKLLGDDAQARHTYATLALAYLGDLRKRADALPTPEIDKMLRVVTGCLGHAGATIDEHCTPIVNFAAVESRSCCATSATNGQRPPLL